MIQHERAVKFRFPHRFWGIDPRSGARADAVDRCGLRGRRLVHVGVFTFERIRVDHTDLTTRRARPLDKDLVRRCGRCVAAGSEAPAERTAWRWWELGPFDVGHGVEIITSTPSARAPDSLVDFHTGRPRWRPEGRRLRLWAALARAAVCANGRRTRRGTLRCGRLRVLRDAGEGRRLWQKRISFRSGEVPSTS